MLVNSFWWASSVIASSPLCFSNTLYKSVKRAIPNFNTTLFKSFLSRRFDKLVWDFKEIRFYNRNFYWPFLCDAKSKWNRMIYANPQDRYRWNLERVILAISQIQNESCTAVICFTETESWKLVSSDVAYVWTSHRRYQMFHSSV